MKKKAFLLINTSLDKGEKSYVPKSKRISALLSNMDIIRSSFAVTGAYQVIAEIESEDLSQLHQKVSDAVMAIPGIEGCTVCPVLGEIPQNSTLVGV